VSPELYDYTKRQFKYTLPQYWSTYIKPFQEKVTDFLGRFASGANSDELERFGALVNIRVPKVGFKGSSRIVCISEEHEMTNSRNLPGRTTSPDGTELVLKYYKGDSEALRATIAGYKNYISGFILKDAKGSVIDHKYL
jgi:hypothetical protein